MIRTPAQDPAVRPVRVRRWSGKRAWVSVADVVVAEEPLEIRVDNHPVAVVMRTPGHDEELVAGFLLTEGVIRERADLVSVRAHPRNSQGNVMNAFLRPGLRVDLERLTRHVFGASSCGLCGKATVEAVHQQFPPLRDPVRVSASVLGGLPARMRAEQSAFESTGGLHAAALFTADGELRCLREDVGRHNAVDKVLGRAFLDGGLPLQGTVLVVSGRTSFEILQKALAARVPVVAAVGAPSSLAVAFARRARQTLVGFLREDRLNVYAGVGRVRS